jgi:HEAT repeat protein
MKSANKVSIKRLARHLDGDDQIKQYQARQTLSNLECELGAPSKQRERQQVATKIVAVLKETKEVVDPKKPKDKPVVTPAYGTAARSQLIRTLASLGGNTEVSVLEAALDDFEVREMARWALDRMTCERAAEVLAEAAPKSVGVEFRIGIVNSLGRKPSAESVIRALKLCLKDSEPEIRVAAAEALANHADPELDSAIAAVGKTPGGRTKLRVTKARVRMAERLASDGDKDAARKIYESIASDSSEKAGKKAVEVALKKMS